MHEIYCHRILILLRQFESIITRHHSGLENAVKSNQRNGPDRSHDPNRPAGKIYHNIKISAVEGGNRKGVLYEF